MLSRQKYLLSYCSWSDIIAQLTTTLISLKEKAEKEEKKKPKEKKKNLLKHAGNTAYIYVSIMLNNNNTDAVPP